MKYLENRNIAKLQQLRNCYAKLQHYMFFQYFKIHVTMDQNQLTTMKTNVFSPTSITRLLLSQPPDNPFCCATKSKSVLSVLDPPY